MEATHEMNTVRLFYLVFDDIWQVSNDVFLYIAATTLGTSEFGLIDSLI